MSMVLRLRRCPITRAPPARQMCSASSVREPLLPKWGFFGKTSQEISQLEQSVRADGDRQAAVTRQLAEMALRAQTMITRPVQWFRCVRVRLRYFFPACPSPVLPYPKSQSPLALNPHPLTLALSP